MKKILLLLIAIIPFIVEAQVKQSVVTLKNGTELKGVIKSINPADALTIVIAGIETSIKMTDVAKIEEDTNDKAVVNEPQTAQLKKDEKLIVTDMADYPESFMLKIGNQTLKMILVRGGEMNMGYNGKGSMSMKSEPVHKVTLTSYYLSETFVPSTIVGEVNGKKYKKDFYKHQNWDNVNKIVLKIAEMTNMPVRLPTEAEWEYAACSSLQNVFFANCKEPEHCYDFFDDYTAGDAIDPMGPGKRTLHVFRAYEHSKGKFNRDHYQCDRYFRLAIKVKDVIDKIK